MRSFIMRKQRTLSILLALGWLFVGSAWIDSGLQAAAPSKYRKSTWKPAPPKEPLKLEGKVQYGIRLSNDWKDNPDLPLLGKDGSVTYTFGATLPLVVCSPLYVCSVRLQPGETVNQLDVGDAVRWKVTPAVSGSGETETTHLVIKPLSPNPLTTNMLVVTDRRAYNIKLESRPRDWMPLVSFAYPDEARSEWQAYGDHKMLNGQVRKDALDVASLDFGFRITGKKNALWRPLRVYTDGVKTYIQFPPAVKTMEAPALLAIGLDNKEQLVNYRMVGDRYVVDKVLDRAELVSGVGKKQAKVTILREKI